MLHEVVSDRFGSLAINAMPAGRLRLDVRFAMEAGVMLGRDNMSRRPSTKLRSGAAIPIKRLLLRILLPDMPPRARVKSP